MVVYQQPLNLDLFFGIISWVGIGGEGTLTFRCNWDLPGLLQGVPVTTRTITLSRYLEKNPSFVTVAIRGENPKYN